MKPLRILHVCTSDKVGGAARAAHRLHLAQRETGMDSHMLVLHRTEPSPHVHAPLSKPAQLAQRLKLALSARTLERQQTPSNPVLHSMNRFNSGLGRWINRSDFDIVNLHWLGAEMLSINEIGRIRQPVVWTMHDMWPFCGAEHYDDLDHPGRYLNGYTAASRPSSYQGADIDARVWRHKKKAWAGKRFHLVSPSRWLAGCARQSALMGQQPCHVIPNCVDTRAFKPLDRKLARQILNLAPDKRYILFGAMASTSDRRKGFHLLQPALKQLAARDSIGHNTELLIFGASAPEKPMDLGLPAHYMGHLHDDISLALLYAAADVFAAPSMQDNLPNTLVEAMACGTPCVAFALGGMTDLITPQITGALSRPFEVADFCDALANMLQHPPARETIRQAAAERYSPVQAAQKYEQVYALATSAST